MAYYFGTFAGAANAENWTVDADTAGDIGYVTEVTWGGEVTTSTAMRSRWTRPTTGGTTYVSIAAEAGHPSNTSRCRFGTFTTGPTLAASPSGLYHTSWNAHGGIGRWLAAPGEEWAFLNGVGQGQISCTSDVGTATSTHGVGWRED